MAAFSFDDASVVINSVDLSDHVRSITIDISAAELDDSAMGDDWRSRIGGVKDWSVTLEFNQGFAASEVDATLWPLLGTTTTITVKPTSDGVGATNPSYSGSVLVSDHKPLANAYGDLATMSVTYPGAGTLTRTAA